MVFIESVDINNFKSYHHTRHIGPFVGTNAIVGPNGTGKSNIFDAITFAFGDVSKNLRVERLNQLIHTSTSNESADHCSVRVRITLGSSENEKGYEFERRLKRNGGEEFFINSEKKSKQEYISFLEEHGIFAKNDNFVIRQGSILKMVNDGDNNRTKFIDVVSGSCEYEQPLNQLQTTHEKMMAQVKAHQEAAQKNGRELHQLSVAHGKRKDIEEDMLKLSNARIDYYLLKMYPIEKRHTTIESKFQKQKANLEKELTDPEDVLLEDEKQKTEEYNIALMEERQAEAVKIKAEAEYQTTESKFEAYNKTVARVEAKIATLEKFIKTLDAKSQERENHQKDLDDKIKNLENDLKALDEELLRVSQSSIGESQLAEFYELQKIVDGDKVNDEIKAKSSEVERIRSQIQALKDSLKVDEEKFLSKQRELALLDSNDDPAQKQLQSFHSQLEDVREQIEQIKANDTNRKNFTKELDDIQRQLADQERNMEYNHKQQLRDRIEHELLNEFSGRVFGVLSKVCTPVNESYTLPAARVFQKWKNAFVVDSTQTAEACIQVLKAKKYPRQKFIPVDDSLSLREVGADVQSVINSKKAQLVRQFINLRHENPMVGRAIDFVCGSTLISDTSDQARKVAYQDEEGRRFTVVSKDGTIFKKGGTVTGGSGALLAQGDPFNPSQAEQLQQRKQQLMALLHDIPRSEGLIANKYAREKELEGMIAKFEHDRPNLAKNRAQRRENTQRMADDLQEVINRKTSELETLESRLLEIENTLEGLNKRKKELTTETFANFCEKNSIQNLDVFQEEDIELRKSFDEKKEKIQKLIKKYQTEKEYIVDSRADERQRAEQNLQAAKDELVVIRGEWETARDDNSEKHNEFLRVNAIYEECKKEMKRISPELDELRARLKKIKDIKNKIKKATKEKETLFAALLDELQKLFFECRIKQVVLPLLNGDFENIELFEPGDSESISDMRISPFECKGDYSRFDDDRTQLTNDDNRKKLVESKVKEIADIEKQLTVKESGALSADDYKEKLDKAREIERANIEKFAKLSKDLNETKRNLNDLKTKRNDRFMETFNKMKKDVDYYYKLLYNDGTAQAYLNIVGTGDPYNSKVQFDLVVPGNTRNSLDNLSGGEQSMAVLALLFAGKAKNVNCVLMDEFDAALDRRNMLFVSRFIEIMSSRGIQFIFISHQIEIFAHGNLLVGSVTHCKNSCLFGSILYCIDIRKFTNNYGKYDPDAVDEVRKKEEASAEFKKAVEIKDLPEAPREVNDSQTEEILQMYADDRVKNFLNAVEKEDAFQHCPNDDNIDKVKEIFSRLAFGANL